MREKYYSCQPFPKPAINTQFLPNHGKHCDRTISKNITELINLVNYSYLTSGIWNHIGVSYKLDVFILAAGYNFNGRLLGQNNKQPLGSSEAGRILNLGSQVSKLNQNLVCDSSVHTGHQ